MTGRVDVSLGGALHPEHDRFAASAVAERAPTSPTRFVGGVARAARPPTRDRARGEGSQKLVKVSRPPRARPWLGYRNARLRVVAGLDAAVGARQAVAASDRREGGAIFQAASGGMGASLLHAAQTQRQRQPSASPEPADALASAHATTAPAAHRAQLRICAEHPATPAPAYRTKNVWPASSQRGRHTACGGNGCGDSNGDGKVRAREQLCCRAVPACDELRELRRGRVIARGTPHSCCNEG